MTRRSKRVSRGDTRALEPQHLSGLDSINCEGRDREDWSVLFSEGSDRAKKHEEAMAADATGRRPATRCEDGMRAVDGWSSAIRVFLYTGRADPAVTLVEAFGGV